MSNTKRETGGPAFAQEGMTLRDYFAGQAMVGLISYDNGERMNRLLSPNHRPDEKTQTPKEFFAQIAYELADAMILERIM